jgi:hypothetical protein
MTRTAFHGWAEFAIFHESFFNEAPDIVVTALDFSLPRYPGCGVLARKIPLSS